MILESLQQEKKTMLAGQMTLFDMMGEEEKKTFDIKFPDMEEYTKQELLAFEKEVLGIYISGHPMEDYEDRWRKGVTAKTTDFIVDEETGGIALKDNQMVTVGGMITDLRTKITRRNQMMVFFVLEDLYGSVEIVVFPQVFEKYRHILKEDEKVFIKGRVDAGEDRDGKVLAQEIVEFDKGYKELWLQFPNKEGYMQESNSILEMLRGSEGNDKVVIYINDIRAIKRLENRKICISESLLSRLKDKYGKDNVKIVDKTIVKI